MLKKKTESEHIEKIVLEKTNSDTNSLVLCLLLKLFSIPYRRFIKLIFLLQVQYKEEENFHPPQALFYCGRDFFT